MDRILLKEAPQDAPNGINSNNQLPTDSWNK